MDRLNSAVNAIKARDINTLQLLLDQDAGLVNQTEPRVFGEPGYTLPHYAASSETLRHSNRRPIAQVLIDAGASVNVGLPDQQIAFC
jgi:hypothetical protein